MIYLIASLTFSLIILFSPIKLKKPSFDIIKGCGITPIGNVIDSLALTMGNMLIITPISSLYSVFTHYTSRFVLKEKIHWKEKIFIITILLSTLILITINVLK
jgi:uncharacterized membrane protein